MNPMTRQITDYINSMGFSFSKFGDKFVVEMQERIFDDSFRVSV
jgi:hypothetical protein